MLIDSPPIMAAADPMILAGYADGVILAVTMGETRTDALREAVSQMQKTGTQVIGYVLNKVKSRRLGYGRYHYRYHYYYYPRREDVETSQADGTGDQHRRKHRSRDRQRHSSNGTNSVISRIVDRVKHPLGNKE